MYARTSRKRARARFAASARNYGSYARVRAQIFTKINTLINLYLMKKRLKFRKDPSFRWGDISLFVTMYDLDQNFLSFSKPPKNAILNVKIRFSWDTLYLILLHRIVTTPIGEQ